MPPIVKEEDGNRSGRTRASDGHPEIAHPGGDRDCQGTVHEEVRESLRTPQKGRKAGDRRPARPRGPVGCTENRHHTSESRGESSRRPHDELEVPGTRVSWTRHRPKGVEEEQERWELGESGQGRTTSVSGYWGEEAAAELPGAVDPSNGVEDAGLLARLVGQHPTRRLRLNGGEREG